MGISHEYHSAPRRARRGTVSGKLRFLGAVVAILLVSYAITAILEKGAEGADDTPSTNASGIAENILAPLPMQGEADSSSAAQDGSTGAAAPSHWRTLALQSRALGPTPSKPMMPASSASPAAGRWT